MKKYRILDVETDECYEVEEVADEPVEAAEPVEAPKDACVKDEGLAPEEIEALKKLAAVADKLIALAIPAEEKVEDETETGLEEVDETIEDEEIETETEEKVVETDRDTCDSKASFGSIERRKTSASDSAIVDEISLAWAKRYNGGNK